MLFGGVDYDLPRAFNGAWTGKKIGVLWLGVATIDRDHILYEPLLFFLKRSQVSECFKVFVVVARGVLNDGRIHLADILRMIRHRGKIKRAADLLCRAGDVEGFSLGKAISHIG